MPTITAIEPQHHDPERVNVFIDGEFAFGATRFLALSKGIREGRELTPAEVESLRHDDAVDRAFNAALNLLSYRPRSRREIEDYFRRKKADPTLVPPVLERLERVGLVNDREFARFWIENRQAFRPRGTRALQLELRQKGVESEVIHEALEGVGDEEETAYAAGQKKLRSLTHLEERQFFQRMVGFLQRRGFPYDVSSAAARRLWSESQEVADAQGEL